MPDIKKLKSFGIIEAMVASIVIILVLTGAVALMSNLVKGSTTDASYQEAEAMAEEVFSQIEAAKAANKLYFVDPVVGRFPVECFDNSFLNNPSSPNRDRCFASGYDYDKLLSFYTLGKTESYAVGQFDPNNFFIDLQNRNKSIADGFFKLKTSVGFDSSTSCANVGGVVVPNKRCRVVVVDVRWEDKNGEQTYKASQRFSDW